MAETIPITYDLLFDILRYEKSRDELQQLDEEFYMHVASYIRAKEDLLINSQTPVAERELTRIQLGNIKKLLTELYERREKKIINLAIYRIKTNHDVISTNALLSEERGLFDTLMQVFSAYRESVSHAVLDGRAPQVIAQLTSSPSSHARAGPVVSVDTPFDTARIVSVRFIKSVPRFLGPELETYGPFEPDDIASLPGIIARALVTKQRAEEIHTS